MASTIISRTQSGAESAAGRRTWTFSCWFKKTGLGSCELFGSDSDGLRNNNYFIIDFNSSNNLDISEYISGSSFRFITNRKFRDTNAWYHLVLAFDSTQGTSSNRVKIYINGIQETSFSTANYPSQDYQTKMFAQNKIHAFGRNTAWFDGCISHCHAAEGTAYAPTVFGSTDSTTGEWKITTDVSVTYGTNGFFLFKNDNSVTNQAGNSSGNFAVTNGTFTKTEDCPSNVFATINALSYAASLNYTLKNGNTAKDVTNTTNAWRSAYGTIGASSGKYYFELKVTGRESGDPGNMFVGIVDSEQMKNESSNERFVKQTRGYGFHAKGYKENNSNNTSYGSSWHTVGDIIGVAMDLDNSKIYFSKNGTWQNSGVPTSGSTGTGAAFTLASGYTYLPAFSQYYGNEQYAMNFGNGYFQSTAVSSAGTNASSNGIFEYDVPNGFTALSTKGLNL